MYKMINNRLDKEELVKRDKGIIERICNDDNYAYYFFHEKCKPLFCNILWKIYGNNADYDELVNELYLLLKKPDKNGDLWHNLKTFDYRTSLFDWIKIVAIRFFYTPCDEYITIPKSFIDSGFIEEVIAKLKTGESRKFIYFKYIKQLDNETLAEKLKIDSNQLSKLSRRSIKSLNSVIKNDYPEYYNSIFGKKEIKIIDIDDTINKSSDNSISTQESKIDIDSYLESMLNDRYRYVLTSLFLKEISPEDLAVEMNTPVSNIYNIKKRALDQIRDVIIYYQEIQNLNKYIDLIPDDRKRNILISIFIKREDYETICSNLHITEKCFKQLKKEAIKELKKLIFK